VGRVGLEPTTIGLKDRCATGLIALQVRDADFPSAGDGPDRDPAHHRQHHRNRGADPGVAPHATELAAVRRTGAPGSPNSHAAQGRTTTPGRKPGRCAPPLPAS